MDVYGKLQLKWLVGYNGSPLHFVDNSTLVYGTGNSLCFIHHSGRHVKSLPSQGSGVGPIATAPQASTVVYAESTLNPKVFAIHYPSYKQLTTLKDGAKLEYVSLAVSNSAKRLVGLTGVPDFLLILWDLVEGCELCRTSVGPGGCQLSLNPLNWQQMCVLGPERLTLYLLEQCSNDQLMLTAQETTLPETSMQVGTSLQPPQLPLSATQVQSEMERHCTTTDQPTLPDLSRVLYKETYSEYTHERSPVVLTSHCWSSRQTLYVGCRSGQLLSVDFDTGITQVLVNTQLSASSSEGAEGEGRIGGSPNTAHAVLGEGTLECLALSKRGLFTAGKDGGLYCFRISAELPVLESHTLPSGDSISCLSWSPDYTRMVIGTHQASILVADPLHLSACSLLSAHGHSPVVGLDMLTPGSENIVTCREDGTVQVWSVEDASLVSNYSLEQEACCLACPMSCQAAVVGCLSGHMCTVSLTRPATPALVAQTRLYRSPITAIRSDQRGQFLAVASSTDHSVFLCSGLMSKGFMVLGHTGIKGNILDLSLLTVEPGNDGSTYIAVLSTHNKKAFLTLFQLPNSIMDTTSPDMYMGSAKEFSNEFIWRLEVVLTESVSRFVLPSHSTMFAALSNSPELAKFTLPPLKEKAVNLELSPDIIIPAHDMSGIQLELSFHQKWIASAASDGRMVLRLAETPEKHVSCTPHHYQTNGCTGIVLSRDCQHIITVGDEGTITCWNWDFTSHGSLKAGAAKEYAERVLRSLSSQHECENSALEKMALTTDTSTTPAEGERTWLEVAEESIHKAEDEKYADLKLGLRQEIGELREKLLGMIGTNEKAPDMEKLGREEFILDMEEHDRLQAEENELIQRVREEIEMSNLAKMFLREQIKSECWDSMTVKGRVIKGFRGSLEVSNYPMMTRSEEELKELARVRTLRAVELAEGEVRQEATASLQKTEEGGEEEEGGDTKVKEGGEEEDTSALYGSHGPKYGGGCDLLYSQFELHSAVAKKHQIVLLQDCLYRIAETFNKEFEEVARLKQAEIARIREKNMRILKIIHQLQLEEELIRPTLYPEEQPKEMLTVQDGEVQVEKYLSPEEKQKLEEVMRLEEEKRLAEMGDNPRERALDMMMGGRLEANVEEDLFKDLPRPDVMLKDPAERTEEEIRAVMEFEKKEAAFLEEREKMKKALEGELRKLQSTISQAMDKFDERLHKLFQLKINTEMAMHQEQLKIVGLVSSLQVEEEVAGREKQLNTLLRNKKTLKAQLSSVLNTAKQNVKDCREQYDQMLAEDKTLDRNFKRDFSDCEPFVDQLYKLFKRRPRGQRLKQGTSEGGLTLDPKSQNPFPHRPPTAVGGQKLATRASEDGMADLDHVSHMPDGVDTGRWDRLVAARRKKWDSELKVKAVALQLAEMESFLKRRLAEEEQIQTEIQDAFSELNRLSEEKTLFNLDLTVQLLLKQGQVEVDEGDFVPDYSESVLVHRRVIEDLNKEIKTHGEGKLASMNECKDFKRGIRMLEWECSRLQMQVDDLQDQARDVQLLRVTKDLNLNEGSPGGREQHSIETLEKTLEINERTHKKKVHEKKQQLARLQIQRERRREENRTLDHTLMDKQVSVLERQAAEKLAGVAPSEAGARQRMAYIVSRRRMVELARAQAAEIAVLRAELERLRMATFPALVQVD